MAQPSIRLWRQRNFLLLWCGQSISQVGSQVTIWALPLTAVLVLRASPMQTGFLTAASIAPYVLAGLLAGAWVDRVRRRPLMIAADVGRALLLLSIPLAAWSARLTLPQLYGVAVGTGLCAIVFDVAYGAFLPSVVARERLLEANGQLEASNAVARIAGPGLAGVLVQLLSGPSALLLDALSFVVSFGSLLLVRTHEARRARAPRQQPSWLHDVGQGVRRRSARRSSGFLIPCWSPSMCLTSSVSCAFLPRSLAGYLLWPGLEGCLARVSPQLWPTARASGEPWSEACC